MYEHIGTPIGIYREMAIELGCGPDWDYAAGPRNKERIGLDGWGINDDSLEREWLKDGFLHPPYNKIKEFLRHALRQAQRNHIDIAILVPSRVIGASHFREYWDLFLKNPKRVDIVPIWGNVSMDIIDDNMSGKFTSPGSYLKIYIRMATKSAKS